MCDPPNTVCVVQNDGQPGDPECDDGYLSYYGANQKSTGLYVNAGKASAYAMAHESCGHWFFHDQHAYGVSGGGPTSLLQFSFPALSGTAWFPRSLQGAVRASCFPTPDSHRPRTSPARRIPWPRAPRGP